MMAGRKRPNGGKYKSVCTTISVDVYERLSDYAWDRHLSLSMALEELLAKALGSVEPGK